MKTLFKFIGFIILVLLPLADTAAQCAMCRTQLENNFSNGNTGIGAGMNVGILYLLIMPYLAVFILGYFWYKSSKNGRRERNSTLTR